MRNIEKIELYDFLTVEELAQFAKLFDQAAKED